MTTYAPIPAFVDQKRHPHALLMILGAHAAVIAAVMMAKGYVPIRLPDPPTTIELINEPPPPPENPLPPQPQDHRSTIDHPTTPIPIPPTNDLNIDTTPLPPLDPRPIIEPPPTRVIPTPPVRTGPRFLTRESDVKPPYPASKLRDGEEAVLRLRIAIDERGRVTVVEPVGAADPVFLAAARRHLIARWRYQPAMEDGHPVPTSTVITLSFQLNG